MRHTLRSIVEASGLNITPEAMDFHRSTIDSLITEAWLRIRSMPFDKDQAYVNHTGDLNSIVLTKLCMEYTHRFTNDVVSKFPVFNHSVDMKIFKQMRILKSCPARRELVFSPVGKIAQTYNTQINGMTAAGPGLDTMVVRGNAWPRKDMPLYLESGADDFRYVYPIFDWSPTQLWAAVLKYQLPLPTEA